MSAFNKYLIEKENEIIIEKNILSEAIDINSIIEKLRDLSKIKNTIYTTFGVQVDFYKMPDSEDLNKIIKKYIIKNNSIWINF